MRVFKGVLTVQLYSTKTHSHPTAYVYSKRRAWSWATTAFRGTLKHAYHLLRTPAQATAPSGRTHSPNLQCVRSSFEFENHLWYISARYHAIRLRSVPSKGQRLTVGGDEACAYVNTVNSRDAVPARKTFGLKQQTRMTLWKTIERLEIMFYS